jgi:hypothetical protein
MTEEPISSEPAITINKSNVPFLVPIYIFIYTLTAIWILIDGFLTNFSFILNLWTVDELQAVPPIVNYLIFTMVGAILGSALLGIISFHRYQAIEKSFDVDHLWGFLFSPLLALIVGILMFAIIQSGLVVLSGNLASATNPENAKLGYLAIGGISGYNWDVVVNKIQNLSKDVLHTEDSPQ